MNRALIAFTGALVAVTLSACSSVPVEPDAPPLTWVERDVVVHNSQAGSVGFREVVLSENLPVTVGPKDSVRWISGVDVANSKFQRMEPLGGRLVSGASGIQGGVVKHDLFPVWSGELSVDGLLAIEKFKAKPNERIYVEFLHSSEMNELAITEMTKAWRNLSARLKLKGNDLSNVVVGGNKFNQSVNAIVLVRVGK